MGKWGASDKCWFVVSDYIIDFIIISCKLFSQIQKVILTNYITVHFSQSNPIPSSTLYNSPFNILFYPEMATLSMSKSVCSSQVVQLKALRKIPAYKL